MSLVQHTYTIAPGNFGLANAQVPTAAGDNEIIVSVALPSATTDHFQNVNCGTSSAFLKSVLMQTTGAPVTVETNNITGSGGQTFVITPHYPLFWTSGMPNDTVVTLAITSGLYITNASTTTATFTARFLCDPTGP